MKRTDAPFHPKVRSQQRSAITPASLQWGHLCRRVRLPAAGHPWGRSGIINYPLEKSRGILRAWLFFFFPGLG